MTRRGLRQAITSPHVTVRCSPVVAALHAVSGRATRAPAVCLYQTNRLRAAAGGLHLRMFGVSGNERMRGWVRRSYIRRGQRGTRPQRHAKKQAVPFRVTWVTLFALAALHGATPSAPEEFGHKRG
jgi:hypothetical protein